jgi:hypothetical protein
MIGWGFFVAYKYDNYYHIYIIFLRCRPLNSNELDTHKKLGTNTHVQVISFFAALNSSVPDTHRWVPMIMPSSKREAVP